MIYKETDEFKKDLKKLSKKYKTLTEDLETIKKNTIELYHVKNINNNSIFPCESQQSKELIDFVRIFKIKKISCRSLKGFGCDTGLRVIYAYYKEDELAEFIQFYHKNESENENRERIREYLERKTDDHYK
jgi:hypothetical protein